MWLWKRFIGLCFIILLQDYKKLSYETVSCCYIALSLDYIGVALGFEAVSLGYANAPGGYSIQLALYSRNFRSMMAYTFCFNAGTSCDVNPATGISARKTDLQRPGLSEKMLL